MRRGNPERLNYLLAQALLLHVLGDVSAPRVCIVEGAQFNGAVEMTQAPATEVESSAPTTTPKTTKPNEVLTDKAVEDVLSGK